MTMYDNGFGHAQKMYDQQEPPEEIDWCDVCAYFEGDECEGCSVNTMDSNDENHFSRYSDLEKMHKEE